MRQPALVQRVDLQAQQLLLLRRQRRDPRRLVEAGGLGVLGRAEEGGYAAVDLFRFLGVRGGVGGFTLKAHDGGADYAEEAEWRQFELR